MRRDFGILSSASEDANEAESCIGSQLWHALAGNSVKLPPINSTVIYFPQGHVEHARENVDFGNYQIPSEIHCSVSSIKYKAEHETDEVFAKVRLTPVRKGHHTMESDEVYRNVPEEKYTSFAKTLTQSDANNGGGFSVPRACADSIFPALDFNFDTPTQNITAKDVHGVPWQFRHIYRGTPRRHLLTTGWSTFVNDKRLIAGDSIVFMKSENGELSVGIRRAKREYVECSGSANEGDPEPTKSDDNSGNRGKLSVASVIEAATRAASGQPFEFDYYPSSNLPVFFVSSSVVRASISEGWYQGMRIKMAVETQDSNQVKCFVGSVLSVEIADPVRWPNSSWRLLQVSWDEPGSRKKLERVNPWLVEVIEDLPFDQFSPLCHIRKKMRLPPLPEVQFANEPYTSSLTSNLPKPIYPLHRFSPENIPGGIPKARLAQFGLPSSASYRSSDIFPFGFHQFNHPSIPLKPRSDVDPIQNSQNKSNLAGIPIVENPPNQPCIRLFGRQICIEVESTSGRRSPEENTEKASASHSKLEDFLPEETPCNKESNKTDHELKRRSCKIFIDERDVNWVLDLSSFSSYDELYERLANMFGTERNLMLGKVVYCDAKRVVKQTGDEPFTEFLKNAVMINVLTNAGN